MGALLLAVLGAVLSLLVSGYVFGIKNNLFHLPIVGMLYDEPQFRGDEFIQSLRHYAAGPFFLDSRRGRQVHQPQNPVLMP